MRTFLTAALMAAGFPAFAGEWTKLPSLPDKEGFAGSFAGVSHDALLVAGGANFPDKKPWEGGTKVYYDTVFVLEKPDGAWKLAGKLPRPSGYGVSVTHGNAVVCVGGGDAERYYTEAFTLEWRADKLATNELPPLPKPLADACGALVGDVLYVAGGRESPNASAVSQTIYRMDLTATAPKWVEVEAFPGKGRMLAVAAGFDGAFWFVGGVDLVVGKDDIAERKYLKDAYRYDPGKGWTRIADLPHPIAAAPSPAPADSTGFYVLGGDDGSQVGVAPDRHRGFGKQALRYDPKGDQWVEAGELCSPRATVPCVPWRRAWVIPSGEARPGVRSPEVWSWTPGSRE